MNILLLGPYNKYMETIISHLELSGDSVFHMPDQIVTIYDKIDFIISFGYRFIINDDILNAYKGRIINMHISYLPYNRGSDPNFWSWLDNTPKGITIHHIDSGVDTGDIIIQKDLTGVFNACQHSITLESTYEILQWEIVALLLDNWEKIKGQKIEAKKQNNEQSTYHNKKQMEKYAFLLNKKGWSTPVREIEQYGRKING